MGRAGHLPRLPPVIKDEQDFSPVVLKQRLDPNGGIDTLLGRFCVRKRGGQADKSEQDLRHGFQPGTARAPSLARWTEVPRKGSVSRKKSAITGRERRQFVERRHQGPPYWC